MGPVSIGVEVQRNTDGDTPSKSPGQVRSNFEYDYPDRVQAYHDRGFRFGRTIKYARADTLQHVHNDQLRSVNIGCDFGLTTVTIMVEGDHN